MEKTDQALSKILNALADKFGTTVNHLYSIMIRQAYIDGFENLFLLVLIITLAIFYVRFLNSSYKSSGKWCENWIDYFDENTGIFIITVLVAIITLGTVIGTTIDMIDCFCNPEYYALHQILKG